MTGWFTAADERQRRWRLILGQDDSAESGDNSADSGKGSAGDDPLSEQDAALDQALETIYGDSDQGDLSDSAPDIARWLGDIRAYFPAPVVQVMQQDALKRMKLRKVLDEPELLAQIEPDVDLVANILALKKVMPSKTKETAQAVVRQVVEALQAQLRYPLEHAINGSLHRATRTNRPKFNEIDWQRTIHANLKHYQPDFGTVIPEKLVGFSRKRHSLRDVIICMDTSGSMASSVVYAGIYAAVLASLNAVTTRLVMFDTAVVDVSDQLHDPVELLFGIRLGGGTNIERAVGYCQQQVTRPHDTILILITDLYEGGDREGLRKRVATLVADGVQVVVLLALNDQGAPRFNRQIAQELADLGVPSFACTPQVFPDLMAAVLDRRDLQLWAASQGIVTAPDN
ncbi:MAG: VWA domain-containing protein [Anaerolineae bacterium]|nr:VWA domain-containing protein [Anaerolineae bacterium]